MKEINKHWYLMNTNTHIVYGPFDILECSIKAVNASDLVGYQEIIREKIGNSEIVTVFHGIDLNRFDDDVLPQQFSTLVLGGKYNGHQKLYEHYFAAVDGHEDLVSLIGKHHNNSNFISI